MNDATPVLPDKRLVAASFSRAARTYDSVAGLQRDVGEHLLGLLGDARTPAWWLDLGSGTGYFSRKLAQRWPDANGLAVDIAEGMLSHARTQGGANWYSAGDAESLPLRDECVDLVFTSLAVQWCDNFANVLAEAHRVLRPGGQLAFASLCTGTLEELRASWEAADGQVHVNRFRRFEDYQRLCSDSGLQISTLTCEPQVLHFADVRALTHELKALGAHNLNPGRPGGLTGRARIAAMIAAYEGFRQPAGLPATYQVVYGLMIKQ